MTETYLNRVEYSATLKTSNKSSINDHGKLSALRRAPRDDYRPTSTQFQIFVPKNTDDPQRLISLFYDGWFLGNISDFDE